MIRSLAPLLALAACAPTLEPDSADRPTPPTIAATPIALVIAGFDSDADLRISRGEFDAGVARSFASGDADRNGTIGLIELTGWSTIWLGSAGALPGRFDFEKDGDDAISRAEFAAEFDRRFTAMDANRDGMLARAEMLTMINVRYGPRGRDRRPEVQPPR